MMSVKSLAESLNLTTIPSTYTFINNPRDLETVDLDNPDEQIPIIDFSLLYSSNPHQRSKVISDLGKACEDWGFFMVINHGVPKEVMDSIIEGCRGFFNLSEEEKLEFKGKQVSDPIRYGTSFHASAEEVFFWRDFLKVIVHPQFHPVNKPPGFSEVCFDYCKKTEKLTQKLLEGISESLGLEASYIDKAMNVECGLRYLAANLYPPCPQPEIAMGMPPHSDIGLLTTLIHNGIDGLQIQHNGKWVNVNTIPNSILFNIGDHLEILSNGKYKSVVHRAVVNNRATRISVAIANGPSLETVVSPAPKLVDNEAHPPAFTGIKYKDYFQIQQANKLHRKSCLDSLRI
ncbi:2-oxoglutarate-dependent dioxygenase 19 [Ziziphus jujuba]|uniref:2-oxoglutarate-dependent dioxygenase 19 n=1 Tax=Ziziphus jujuba TaxID=326968 RepID=A0A6P4AW73_ZIZJJ|nr:2-oxoglutarate-dependent dioxygenase 19 [Ziziphus jujuba]